MLDDGTTNIGRRRATAKADGGPAYEARRQAIIEAAGQVFLRLGYDATTFKHIADEIGLDRASLYYYFASKQEIFQAATGAAVAHNADVAEQVAAGDADPIAKITRIMELVLEAYTDTASPYVYIFMKEDIARITADDDGDWAERVWGHSRRWESAVTAIFADGVERGVFTPDLSPSLLTKALIGMTNWVQRWYRPGGALSPEQIADQFTRMLLDGIVVGGRTAGG